MGRVMSGGNKCMSYSVLSLCLPTLSCLFLLQTYLYHTLKRILLVCLQNNLMMQAFCRSRGEIVK